MKEITKNEALEALRKAGREGEQFSIVGGPDRLGPLTVFFVQVWNGEDVTYEDVMFYRIMGKVRVKASNAVLAAA